MMGQASLQLKYDPMSIDVLRLANLLVSLNPGQKEALELTTNIMQEVKI